MQQKCSLLAFDDLLKLCMDFNTDDEIEEARLLMSKVVPCKRFGMPKGYKKDIANRTLSALMKICLDPNAELPTFCAVNLARLLPVDTEHIDICAVLRELQHLQAEVRTLRCVGDEIVALRQELSQLKSESGSTRNDYVLNKCDFLSLPINERSSAQFSGSDDAGEGQEVQHRMFSDHARDLHGSGMRQSQPKILPLAPFS